MALSMWVMALLMKTDVFFCKVILCTFFVYVIFAITSQAFQILYMQDVLKL